MTEADRLRRCVDPPAGFPSRFLTQPGAIYLDPAWLRREYFTWHRSLDDIAAQIGCPVQTLNRFAREHLGRRH